MSKQEPINSVSEGEQRAFIKICSFWMHLPHTSINSFPKEYRITVARVNLERLARERYLLGRLVAIDESWVALYSPPARDQMRFWLEPGAAAPNVPLPELHERKRLMIMAMDWDGVAFFSFLGENETLTSEKYCHFLNEYMEVWCQKKNVRKPEFYTTTRGLIKPALFVN
jgi:hypothetical protein